MGNLVALLIVVLIACIILKISKKVIGFLLIVFTVFLLMKFAVPLVM